MKRRILKGWVENTLLFVVAILLFMLFAISFSNILIELVVKGLLLSIIYKIASILIKYTDLGDM